MKNIGLKLFSLGLAIFLAYFVSSDSNSSVVAFPVSIEVKNVPAGKIVLQQSARQAQVTVKGPSVLVSRIASTPPIFRISLPPDVSKSYSADFNREDLDLPSYVQVVSIDPPQVKLTFDNLVEKKIAVVVPRIGNLRESLRVEELDLVPSQVTVKGPESELKGLLNVETYPIDLRVVDGDLERKINLRLPSFIEESSANEVKVRLHVGVVEEHRKLTNLPIEIRAATGASYSIDPSKVTLELAGTKDAISKIKNSDVMPYVRVSEADVQLLSVSVDLPEGIRVVQIDPSQVRIVKAGSRNEARRK